MAKARQRGWWYPYIFLGMFVVVVGVNGTMAYFATSTFSGLSTENAYEKGLAYNQNLAMAKAQAAMGWTEQADMTPVPGQAGKAGLGISYRDRNGKPVTGLEVRASLSRPAVRGYERDVRLAEAGNGRYDVDLSLPLSGAWDVEIVAVGTGVAYQSKHRFILP